MITKELTCVVCPNGCPLTIEIEKEPVLKILKITGSTCKKGDPWAYQEIENPMRTIASSILVDGGDFKLVSVRTDSPIPLKAVPAVMDVIRKTKLNAPVKINTVLISKPAGQECNIIATRSVNKK